MESSPPDSVSLHAKAAMAACACKESFRDAPDRAREQSALVQGIFQRLGGRESELFGCRDLDRRSRGRIACLAFRRILHLELAEARNGSLGDSAAVVVAEKTASTIALLCTLVRPWLVAILSAISFVVVTRSCPRGPIRPMARASPIGQLHLQRLI